MAITFSAFNDAVQRVVFPEGSAENLVANHKLWVKDALIDLQRKVKCLQVNHTDYVASSATFFHCGASIFEAPRGFIVNLTTLVAGDTCCDEVIYHSCSKDQMDCFLLEQENCSFCPSEVHAYGSYLVDDVYVPYPYLPLYCFEYPDLTIDKPCRAISGFFTIHRGQVWMTPHLQSGELAKLEWDGIKRAWNDADVMDDDIIDRDVTDAVEFYLMGKAAAVDDCDIVRGEYFNNESVNDPGQYQIKRADLIHNCLKETRPPKRDYCFNNC